MKYSRAFIVPLIMLFAAGVFARPDKHAKKNARGQVERVVAADPSVVVTVCVAAGDIKVRGWDRNQVRARSNDTSEIELARTGVLRDSDPAKEIRVLLAGQVPRKAGSCLANGDIELDVPRGASVRLQTRAGDIDAADVSSVYANTVGGGVNLEAVKRSIEANTIGGDISLRNSSGSVKIHSVGGGIEARGVVSAAAGDVFEASSVGGDLVVERASYPKLSVSTIDGDLNVSGPLVQNGRYEFKTISGDINLVLPADSSFRLDATLSRNAELVTDFPLKTITDTGGPLSPPSSQIGSPRKRDSTAGPGDLVKIPAYGLRRINAVYGTGDALITVSSFSGSLHLRKK